MANFKILGILILIVLSVTLYMTPYIMVLLGIFKVHALFWKIFLIAFGGILIYMTRPISSMRKAWKETLNRY